ncbi:MULTISPECIES: hypothetical protein [Pelosinus]|uniref:Uncharacterized protein n=1 Tax=Pelosinus fermentans B4 TaxID=1149862 RepID=I9LE66_9FIRM|nr:MULTISPECIES: hypothetical protein [Pelosinus]EIW18759.1 hypothetical protein FB4_0284 [Pelosinus fermentans B4]EIW22031.1 hypothetical protein FA11_0838 [Pelosinus fermentans A11]OAM95117.1 hypothetical protein FR7_03138 [Pelosinus fermentans DSM 17108]SDR23544.1 hypothetical protein SAMN04515679_3269 [Pelosinus fermentans]
MCTRQYPDGQNCEQVGRRLDQDFFDALFDGILSNVSAAVTGSKDEAAIKDLRAMIGQKMDKVSQEDKALNGYTPVMRTVYTRLMNLPNGDKVESSYPAYNL